MRIKNLGNSSHSLNETFRTSHVLLFMASVCDKQNDETLSFQVCAPSLASRAVDLLESFVKWHAVDIYEWHVSLDHLYVFYISNMSSLLSRHVSSDRLAFLAPSCGLLAEKQGNEDEVGKEKL